jgi:hypothetical protein
LTGALLRIAAVLAIIVASWVGSIQSVQSVRKGCERNRERDRNAAIAWTVAAAQRKLDGDYGTATAYDTAAETLWRFAVIDCARAFPYPWQSHGG